MQTPLKRIWLVMSTLSFLNPGTYAATDRATATVTVTSPPAGSKLGVHVVIGPRNGYGGCEPNDDPDPNRNFLRKIRDANKTLAAVHCVDEFGACAQAKQCNPLTVTIGRLRSAESIIDPGRKDAVSNAVEFYAAVRAKWLDNPYIDYWEAQNEIDSLYDWQRQFYIRLMELAEPDGVRLALFSSSTGTPKRPQDDGGVAYSNIKDTCLRAKQGGHILSLHEYGGVGNPFATLEASAPYLHALRYRILYDYLRQHDAVIPLVITECAQNGGYEYPGLETFMEDFQWYDDELIKDDYVLGATIFTLGNWANANFQDALPALGDYIASKASTSACATSVPSSSWRGEYFANRFLSGTPFLVRDDGAAGLSFDWSTGSPASACGIGADNFSARWTRTVSFAAGTYRFDTRTDDGVRLYIDDVLRIDKWVDRGAPPVPDTVEVALAAGNHTLRMEYYENGGLASAELSWQAVGAGGETSLAGVHWYSGDSSMLDLSVPAGQRGFNVEVVFDVGWCDGDPASDPGGVRSVAATAKAHGLRNIIRVDYRSLLAVPTNPNEYGAWAAGFIECTQELSDLARLFVVGNEPNIEDGGRPEGDIRPNEYAHAFNYLYARKGEMPPGTELLATFNSPFTPPAWMRDMSSLLTGVDGFALHTGGIRANCADPRHPCSFGGWNFDGGFRYYRDVIANIHSGWWSRPVYITEFNTFTGDPGSEPANNYRPDWINQAFEEIRSYNATRGSKPAVKALAWFVDRPQSWPAFALRNIPAARADMGEEFRNPANRGGGGGESGNRAVVLGAQSSVPASLAPGEKRSVRIRVQNTGGTTWRAASLHRLGTGQANSFAWSGFACGGYMTNAADGRAYLCADVPPGAATEFSFDITAPGGNGSVSLAVHMVQDGVEWFEEAYSWTIGVGNGNPYPDCACRSGIDNYCHIPPRTAGCPMTQPGGYCDPNGDGGYNDADWVRGYNEYVQYCR